MLDLVYGGESSGKNTYFDGTRFAREGISDHDDDDLTHDPPADSDSSMTNYSGSSQQGGAHSMMIGVSLGEALGMAADQYKTVRAAILEAIQNALDAGPTRINLVINKKTGKIFVQDNGCGASKEHMRACLRTVCKSKKTKGKIGQFGIGVIAFYRKCRRFYFTSCPAGQGDRNAYRIIFNVAQMEKSVTESEAPFVPQNISGEWWNSQLEVEGVKFGLLKSQVPLDELHSDIYKSYALALKKYGTVLTIKMTEENGVTLPTRKVVWVPFKGKAEKPRTYSGGAAGETVFTMFTVRPDAKGRRRGQGVRVVDSTKLFSRPLTPELFPSGERGAGSLLAKKTCDAITGGVFEGEIQLSDNLKLGLDRHHFESDDASFEAVLHIESWLADVGSHILKSIETEEDSARLEEIVGRGLEDTHALLKDDKALADLLRSEFKWGSQGTGHNNNSAKENGGFTGKRPGSKGGRPPGPNKPKDPGKKPGKKNPPKDKPNDTPLIHDTPGSGPPRTEVRDDSTGLRIRLIGGGQELWDLDKKIGLLIINIAHQAWADLDEDAVSTSTRIRNDLLCSLQKRVIQAVLGVVHTAVSWGYPEDDYDMLMNHMHVDTLRFAGDLLRTNMKAKATRAKAARARSGSGKIKK